MNSRIMNGALIVFNKKGYLRTQLEDILEESNVSLKEFNHHFSDLKDLIIAIFDQFCKESDQFSAAIDQRGANVNSSYEMCLSTFAVHKKYAFIFHDFYYLNTEIEEIKDMYFEQLRLRKAQLSHLFQEYVEVGIFDKEVIAGQFENLINQILAIGGFWPTQSKVIFGEYNVQYYTNLTFSMLIPYFTEKGLEESNKINHF